MELIIEYKPALIEYIGATGIGYREAEQRIASQAAQLSGIGSIHMRSVPNEPSTFHAPKPYDHEILDRLAFMYEALQNPYVRRINFSIDSLTKKQVNCLLSGLNGFQGNTTLVTLWDGDTLEKIFSSGELRWNDSVESLLAQSHEHILHGNVGLSLFIGRGRKVSFSPMVRKNTLKVTGTGKNTGYGEFIQMLDAPPDYLTLAVGEQR